MTTLGAIQQILDEQLALARCSRRQVACVLVKGGVIVGRGHNIPKIGDGSCIDGDCPRGQKTYDEVPAFSSYENCIAVHAEDWALREAGDLAYGGAAFVTCEPCPDCAALFEAAHVTAIVERRAQ